MGRALRELDVQLLSHLPGNAQAKRKIERFFRFLQERLLDDHKAKSMEELQALLNRWVEDYNARHVNRDTGCTPVERLEPSVARTLEDGADDVFCLKEERKQQDHCRWPAIPGEHRCRYFGTPNRIWRAVSLGGIARRGTIPL